jgi:dTMP kinase
MLFLADRATHTGQIEQWVNEGAVVVCDRYADSTFAYQSVILGEELRALEIEPMEWLLKISRPFITVPDVTLLFVIEPSAALGRIQGEGSKFEKKELLEKIQEVYLELAEKNPRFVKVDASAPIEDVFKNSMDAIVSKL